MKVPRPVNGWCFILATILFAGLNFSIHAAAAQGYSSYLIDLNSKTATGLGSLDEITGTSSYAYALNDAGQVTGYSLFPTAQGWHGFITGPDGVGMTDLGTLGSDYSGAYGINDTGQVVGNSTVRQGDHVFDHAFITGSNGEGMRDLGTLGGAHSSAHAINDAGQVVGNSNTARDVWPHAFITGPDGAGMRDLGTLGGHYGSFASGINDAGQVVGYSYTSEDGERAFVTGRNGEGMTDLNSLVDLPDGVILRRAIDINNEGQVIATQIPEPESYVMLLAGLGLVGFIVRRKRLLV